MSKNRLFDDFSPMSKAEWLDMVANDPRSANLLEKLNWDIAGVSMPAYATREDLETSASLNTDTALTVKWAYPASWQIAQAFDRNRTAKEFKQSLDAGTEAIWLESTDASSNHIDLEELPPQLFHFHGPAFAHQAGLKVFSFLKTQPGSISLLTENDTNISPQHIREIQAANLGRVLSIHLSNRTKKNGATDIGATHDLSHALHIVNQFHTLFNKADLEITALLSSVQFVFTIGTSFYLEIAQFRALRMLLSKLIYELSPSFSETISIPFIAIVPCESNMEEQHTNILRSTTMAMAAAMGGCNLIVTRPFSGDHTDTLATRIARNLQIILKHESHLDHVIDPGAGSYYIETLTHKLAQQAWTQFLTNRDIPA